MSGTTNTFDYTGSVVSYTVQSTGLYDITAFGAQGGKGTSTTGGDGAEATGDALLTQGETLTIIVGGQGGSNTEDGISGGGGGGGGSFVIAPGVVPLVVAGGGGGAAAFLPQTGLPGAGGYNGDNGGGGFPSDPDYQGGRGGIGDQGGQGGQGGTMIGFYGIYVNSAAGGGGGVLSPGTNGQASGNAQNAVGAGGQAATGGAVGGLGTFYAGSGGFGGGGGGAGIAGGGGGGYSGGGGGVDIGAGGGGGSFVDPSAQNAKLTEGGRAGNGLVTITELAQLTPPTMQFTTGNPETANAGTVLSYLTGLGSAIGAIVKLRQHKDNPIQWHGGPWLHSVLSAADLISSNLPLLASSHAATRGAGAGVEAAGSSASLQQVLLSELHSVPNSHWL